MFALAKSHAISGVTTFTSDSQDKKDRSACWQLVCKRDGKRLFHQFGIDRTGQRVVIILFFFNARCLEAELDEARSKSSRQHTVRQLKRPLVEGRELVILD